MILLALVGFGTLFYILSKKDDLIKPAPPDVTEESAPAAPANEMTRIARTSVAPVPRSLEFTSPGFREEVAAVDCNWILDYRNINPAVSDILASLDTTDSESVSLTYKRLVDAGFDREAECFSKQMIGIILSESTR